MSFFRRIPDPSINLSWGQEYGFQIQVSIYLSCEHRSVTAEQPSKVWWAKLQSSAVAFHSFLQRREISCAYVLFSPHSPLSSCRPGHLPIPKYCKTFGNLNLLGIIGGIRPSLWRGGPAVSSEVRLPLRYLPIKLKGGTTTADCCCTYTVVTWYRLTSTKKHNEYTKWVWLSQITKNASD